MNLSETWGSFVSGRASVLGMRAAVHADYGPPDVVRVADHPRPEPGPGEVLVAVHATTVNRTDCAYRGASPPFMRALTGLRRPRHAVWGTEFAGEVVAVGGTPGIGGAGVGGARVGGSGAGALGGSVGTKRDDDDDVVVRHFAPGDRVFGYCEGRFGAHAQYVAIDSAGSIATIPEGISFAEAAAATEGAHYARSAIRRAGVRAGHRVLVNGATGGIGSAGVQLLREAGATVTAVCAGAHFDLVRDLGAQHLIDFTTQDFTTQDFASVPGNNAPGHSAPGHRAPARYDVVFDAVGKSSFFRCRRLLAPGGVYVSSELGPAGQNIPLALAGTVMHGRRRVVFPVPEEGQEMVSEIRDLLATGTFRPVIDRTYPLEEIADAYRYVESGAKIGNVVIEVPQA